MKDNHKQIYAILQILIIIALITACAPESEIKPPETSIDQMQPVYGQSGIRMVLSGTDDKTPAEKLTYQYTFYKKNENEDEKTDEGQIYIEGDSDEILQIDTYNAQIVTIKAVQDLIKENKEVQNELEILKADNKTLKSKLNEQNTKNAELEKRLSEIEKFLESKDF